jgi:hypothetical protein
MRPPEHRPREERDAMHRPSHGTGGHALRASPYVQAAVMLVLSGWWVGAWAMPGFTRQTGQPCVACHVGPVGSPLGPFARQLTLDNYTSDDWRTWPPMSAMLLPVSFILTGEGQPGRQSRAADAVRLAEPDTRAVLTLSNTMRARNNSNALPFWGFPYPSPGIAPAQASTMPADGAPGSPDWNRDAENGPAVYRGTADDAPGSSGYGSSAGTPWIDSFSPRWRVALRGDLERHFVQIGTYTLSSAPPGAADNASSTAAGGSYRFTIDPDNDASDTLSAHATVIYEGRPPGLMLLGDEKLKAPDTFRFDASYSFAATITPSIQYFRTAGAAGVPQFGSPQNRPNSAGVIAEVAYVPTFITWAKADSPVQFLNLRFAAQYVAYTEFNGVAHGTSGTNALNFSFWAALHF